MLKEPVIIDTDPGIDDFMALVLAAKCERFDIKALTPVAGNQVFEKVWRNARGIAKLLGINCVVTKGAEKPLILEQELADAVHGETGLGKLQLPESDAPVCEKYAWDVMYEEAKKNPGKLHIIAIGPLTNVAIAIKKYPDIVGLIGKLSIMGGSAGFGNHSPYGEFNIWVDPHAAAIVFRSGLKVQMFGLDGNKTCQMSVQDFHDIMDVDCAIKQEINDALSFSIEAAHGYGAEAPVLHDAVTMAGIIDESLMEFVECYTDVEVRSKTCFGRTICDVRNTWGKQPNSLVAVKGDKEKFKSVIINTLKKYR